MQPHPPVGDKEGDNLREQHHRHLNDGLADEVWHHAVLVSRVLSEEDGSLLWELQQDGLRSSHHGHDAKRNDRAEVGLEVRLAAGIAEVVWHAVLLCGVAVVTLRGAAGKQPAIHTGQEQRHPQAREENAFIPDGTARLSDQEHAQLLAKAGARLLRQDTGWASMALAAEVRDLIVHLLEGARVQPSGFDGLQLLWHLLLQQKHHVVGGVEIRRAWVAQHVEVRGDVLRGAMVGDFTTVEDDHIVELREDL
mmetsp:Transcript_36512/g.85531  ORF Transcript_36512/g.85531 Transcript_36512/m.85531 type:complete len:251 (-) Transcript_36512:817-1569(-)